MKAILKKYLFNNQHPEPFAAIVTKDESIPEKVVACFGNLQKDISNHHCILSQAPFIVCIWLPDLPPLSSIKLKIIHGLSVLCTVNLSLIKSYPNTANEKILLFKVIHSSSHQLSIFRRWLLYYYFYKANNKLTLKEVMIFAALYSFPRKVVLTCATGKNHFNLFPMDFTGYLSGSGLYLLGLRHSNVTLASIINEKKLVVCDVSSDNKDALYALGKHHSKAAPQAHELPFAFKTTSTYNFSVPDFITAYKELEVISYENLGSHMLLITKVVNQQVYQTCFNHLYHLHIIQHLMRMDLDSRV